jgi:hypothetical protein
LSLFLIDKDDDRQTGNSINFFEDSQYSIWQKFRKQYPSSQPPPPPFLPLLSQQPENHKESDEHFISQPVSNHIFTNTSHLIRKRRIEALSGSTNLEAPNKKLKPPQQEENENINNNNNSSKNNGDDNDDGNCVENEHHQQEEDHEHISQRNTADVSLEISQDVDWGINDFETNKFNKRFF